MPKPLPKTLVIYQTTTGDEPFSRWLDELRERTVRARIRARLDRVSLGIGEITKL